MASTVLTTWSSDSMFPPSRMGGDQSLVLEGFTQEGLFIYQKVHSAPLIDC